MPNYHFDQWIEFVKQNIDEDEEGVKSENLIVEYSCHANRKDLSNTEFVNTYATYNKYIISFRVRACKFTKALEFNTKDYLVRYKGKLFNIVSAIDYQNMHKYIDVKVEVAI